MSRHCQISLGRLVEYPPVENEPDESSLAWYYIKIAQELLKIQRGWMSGSGPGITILIKLPWGMISWLVLHLGSTVVGSWTFTDSAGNVFGSHSKFQCLL